MNQVFYLSPLMGLIILNTSLKQGLRFAPPPAYYLPSPIGLHSKPNIFNNHLNNSGIADCCVSKNLLSDNNNILSSLVNLVILVYLVVLENLDILENLVI